MKFLSKFDDEFVQRAGDPNQRALEVERLKSSRTSYYLGGFLSVVVGIALELTGRAGLACSLFGLFCWIIAFKHESDIRILRTIDFLQKK